VRTTIGAIAQAQKITARAFDETDRNLGEAAVRPIESGWEIRPPGSTVRLEITATK
jgi:hypothetical protein